MTSSSDLFIPIKFTTSVQLKPNELGSNIEDVLYKKLRNNLESICSKHGYIKKNSIKIVKRSIGHLKIPHFNGHVAYDIQCIAEICNPPQGAIIQCKVKAKNSLGVRAEAFYDGVPILQIVIPKISAGIQSEINIDTLKIGDDVTVEVCGKKFLLFDKAIDIIGKAIKERSVLPKQEQIDVVEDNAEEGDEVIDDDKLITKGVKDIKILKDLVGGAAGFNEEDDDGDDAYLEDGVDEEDGGDTEEESEEEEEDNESEFTDDDIDEDADGQDGPDGPDDAVDGADGGDFGGEYDTGGYDDYE
jgi:DNA-directed RNA polymerase subunit E'/Rpb7